MTTKTIQVLTADEGKVLRNKNTGITTPSVWLRIGELAEDWEEIDIPEDEAQAPEDPAFPQMTDIGGLEDAQ